MTLWSSWRDRHAPYRWLDKPVGKAKLLQRFGVVPIATLIETEGGAILVWRFDFDLEPSGSYSELVVFLTNREVVKVVRRDWTREGILEPVRAKMTHRHGFVGRVVAGEHRPARPFTVPAGGSEESFTHLLDRTAAKHGPRPVIPEAVPSFASKLDREVQHLVAIA